MKQVEKLGERLFLIDDFDLKLEERTGTYILLGEHITIIETCASPSLPYILQGLKELDIKPDQVAYIIVTHVHLDHAGAAGLLMEQCKHAKLIVHPRGARHMIDPAKLIKGAQAVYGNQFNDLFHPIVPIPEERVISVQDGHILHIGADRTLTFYDTPGHAKHHISIHDSLTNGIFTGDTIGVYYRDLQQYNVEFYLPTTSPSQFNPDEMLHSMHRIRQLNPDSIYFGHYGKSSNPQEVYEQMETWLPVFLSAAQDVFSRETDPAIMASAISNRLFTTVRTYLTERGVPEDAKAYRALQIDMDLCAMGLVDYLQKQNK